MHADGSTDTGLVRAIRRWDLVALAINGIIGAGIFGLPSKVFALIGAWSLVAFVVCAAVVTLIVLCFAEVASRFTATGGPYLYARETLGPTSGFGVGWLRWVTRLTAFAANCNLLIGYLAFFWAPAGAGMWRAAIIALVVIGLMGVNIVGVRNAARASNLFTVGKLVPLAMLIATGLFFISPDRLSLGAPPAVGDFSKSVLLLVYAFTGFEMAVIPAGEVRDPQRDMPIALLIAIGIVAVVYILVQAVCIGSLPGLAGSERPLADAAGHFLGKVGASIISAGAIVSIVGNLSLLGLAGARLPYAMAERGELPRILAATHRRFATPWCAIIFTCGIGLILALSGTFIYALTPSTLSRLLTYGVTCLALLILRRRPGAPRAAFSVPRGTIAAVLTLALVAWLLSNATLAEARDTAIAGAAGLLVYATYRRWHRRPTARAPGPIQEQRAS